MQSSTSSDNAFQAFACSPGKSSTRAPTTITGVRSDDCAIRHSQSSTSDRAQSGVTTALQKKRKAYARDENATTESTGLSELLGPQPLRLILVGHNPSAHAWASGHYYSNPSNWMWRLLRETGIAPPEIRGAQDDHLMLEYAQVGFVDVGCGMPGTDSSKFSSATLQGWAQGFYDRVREHVRLAALSIGCTCGSCGAPAVVAFAGKRQFMELLNAGKTGRSKTKSVPFGITDLRPQGWPLPEETEVWILPSTSGAAPMTVADRKQPYQDLSDRLASLPLGCISTPHCDRSLSRHVKHFVG